MTVPYRRLAGRVLLLVVVGALASAATARSAPQLVAWLSYAQNAQHTAISAFPAQPLSHIHWQTPVDLMPQYSGSDLLIHYGSPLITAANTVVVPVKTGASGGFQVEGRSGSDGT